MIYLDNGATSYPKPTGVISAGVLALKKYSFNSGRGGYKQSVLSAERIFAVREKIADMFGFEAQNVSFTKNCTEALNIAIKGSVKKGDRIIISSLEHNAVWRTVNKLRDDGIGYQALIAGNITDSTIELRIIDNANSHDTGMRYDDIYYLSEYRG